MRYFKDERYDNVISEDELRDEFEEFSKSGFVRTRDFNEFLANCLDKNGTLTEVWRCPCCGGWTMKRFNNNESEVMTNDKAE